MAYKRRVAVARRYGVVAGAVSAAGRLAYSGYRKWSGGAKPAVLVGSALRTKRQRSYTVLGSNTRTKLSKTGSVYHGKSAGFLRTRKRKRRTPAGVKYGFQATYEFGKVYSSTAQLQVIGHTTMAKTLALRMAWRALFKKLFIKAGCVFRDPQQQIRLYATDLIYVLYRTSSTGSTLSETFGGAGYYTIDQVVDWAVAGARTWNEELATNVEFIKVQVAVGAGNETINNANVQCVNLTCTLACKSTLKIQNRSITTVGENEADDVDNVPLYGKSYGGMGAGCTHISQSVSFMANEDTGIIDNQGATAIQEPPNPAEFDNCKTAGKARIEPGHIKTSVLSNTMRLSFNELVQAVSSVDPTVTKGVATKGSYRFFCLEKMLDATATTISIAVEHNLYMTAVINEKNTHVTSQFFLKTYL